MSSRLAGPDEGQVEFLQRYIDLGIIIVDRGAFAKLSNVYFEALEKKRAGHTSKCSCITRRGWLGCRG